MTSADRTSQRAAADTELPRERQLPRETTPEDDPAASHGQWLLFGTKNVIVVLAVALVLWFALANPNTSPLTVYPLPFNATLFWAILFIVFIGFNAEFAGFDRLRQPVRGVVITGATVVFSVVITAVLAFGVGRLAPAFAADREGGLGYFTGALFVLFGFSTFVMVVLNWQHRPWTDLGLRQPAVGILEILTVAGPTLLIYLIFGVPAVSSDPASALMSVDTVLGWFYSIIVAVVLTGLTWDNWPWSRFGRGWRVAVGSTIGNLVLAALYYFASIPFVKFLLGDETSAALGSGLTQYPAQLGVCWAFSMILWANAFGNTPAMAKHTTVKYLARTVITFALATLTFVFYYRFAAGHLLGEPQIAPGIAGNALGFIDVLILSTLLYVVGFQSYGLRQPVTSVTP